MSAFWTNPKYYKVLSWASAILFALLFVTLLLVPRAVLDGTGLVASAWTDFLCRRAGVIVLGLGVLSFVSRNAPPTATRQGIVLGVGTSLGGLAVLGSVEVARGFASPGLLPAVAVETLFALAYVLAWLGGRQTQPAESQPRRIS